MPEDADGKNQSDRTSDPSSPDNRTPIGSENESGANRVQENVTDNRPHWADVVIAVFTGLILVTYITSDVFLWKQLRLTSKAVRQAKEDNAATILAQQKIAQDALAASQTNFDKSIGSARDQLRLDQRAWLGVDAISGEPKEKARWEITVGIKNTGKTPAKEVSFLNSFVALDKGKKLTFDYSSVQGEASKAMLPPGSVYGAHPPTPKSPLTDMDIKNLKEESITVYIYGKGTYSDVFSCRHWITYCSHMLPDTKSWATCNEHNDTGDYECKVSQPPKP
jgi:hypothetical protein